MKKLLTLLMVGCAFLLTAQSNITFTSSCDLTTVCNETTDCSDIAPDLTATATTDCASSSDLVFSYQLDIGNDGMINITGSGATVSDLLSIGEHRVIFTVTDQCNTNTTCEYVFQIIDGVEPTPVCIFGITTVNVPPSGIIELDASLFNNSSSDNCTANSDLLYSFSQDVSDVTLIIECADIPADGLVPISLYVTDEAGNFDFCFTFVKVEDPNNICNPIPPPITGVVSVATGCGNIGQNVSWDVNGVISPNPPTSVNVGDVITPIANDNNALNGVTTYDLFLMSKHITNTQLLNEPWQLVAADVNNTQTITALDIVKVKAVILGQASQFVNSPVWRFLPGSIVVDNNFTDFKFTAVHLGDVNCTAMLLTSNNNDDQVLNPYNTDARNDLTPLTLSTKNQNIQAGKTYSIPVAAQNFKNIIGGQFTLEFDTDALDFQKIESGDFEDLTIEDFGTNQVDEGMVLCSWTSREGKNLESNTLLYNITFTAKRNGYLSDFLFINSKKITAEAYEENGNNLDIIDLQLHFEESNLHSDLSVFPNPFSQKTTLNFSLENEGSVTLNIFDVNGRTVFSQENEMYKGEHQIEITKKDLSQNGIYFYQLVSPNKTYTGKMMKK